MSNFFLSKAIRKNPNTNRLENTEYARKSTFYVKTKLPKVMYKDDAEAENDTRLWAIEVCQDGDRFCAGLSSVHLLSSR
jgi:hypothetical protein